VEPNLGFVAQLRALDRSLNRARFNSESKEKKRDAADAPAATTASRGGATKVSPSSHSLKSGKSGRKTPPPPTAASAAAAVNQPPPAPHVPSYTTVSPPPLRVDDLLNNSTDTADDDDDDDGEHPEAQHIATATSATPKSHSPSPMLQRHPSLSMSYDEFGHTTVSVLTPQQLEEIERKKAEAAKVHADNHRIATQACDRLYKRALKQEAKLTSMREELPAEFTFSPSINKTSLMHAAVAAARGRSGFAKMTKAQLQADEESKAKAFHIQDRQLKNVTGFSRFEGYNSIFYDQAPTGPRALGRTSPTENHPSFTPRVNRSPNKSPKGKSDGGVEVAPLSIEERLAKGTSGSRLSARIAARKRELIATHGGKGVRDRLSASGMVDTVDEVEAIIIAEEAQKRRELVAKEDIVKKGVLRGKGRSLSPGRKGSPLRDRNADGATVDDSISKETLSFFLKRSNSATYKAKLDARKAGVNPGARFVDGPNSLYYGVEHAVNIDVAHWQYEDEAAKHVGHVIRSKEEEEAVKKHIEERLYADGLKYLKKRDELHTSKPLEKECTFSPKKAQEWTLRGEKENAARKRQIKIQRELDATTVSASSLSAAVVDRGEVVAATAEVLGSLDRDEIVDVVSEFAKLARRDSDVLKLKELVEKKFLTGHAAASPPSPAAWGGVQKAISSDNLGDKAFDDARSSDGEIGDDLAESGEVTGAAAAAAEQEAEEVEMF
jgi:hypothetical protein